MQNISNDAINAFTADFSQCMKKTGSGQTALDTMAVRKLVKARSEVAYRYVEIQCLMAQNQPDALQTAGIIAVAYQVELQDNSLLKMVLARAQALGAEDQLRKIGLIR